MDILDELMVEAGMPQEAPAAPPESAASGGAIKKLRYTHEAMINLIISDPSISQNALAIHFGYSPSWISQVIASDAFQAKLSERSDALIDPIIRHSVEERFKGLVLRSLELLEEKLKGPANTVPDNLVLRSLDITSRAAGYGAKVEPPSGNTVNVNLHLEDLGANLTKLLARKRQEAITEGVFHESNVAALVSP